MYGRPPNLLIPASLECRGRRISESSVSVPFLSRVLLLLFFVLVFKDVRMDGAYLDAGGRYLLTYISFVQVLWLDCYV